MLPREHLPEDQVKRRIAYQAAHPGVRITYRVTHWEAVIPQENGEIIYTRYELRDLLDKLEEL
jgi:hypothetical protein